MENCNGKVPHRNHESEQTVFSVPPPPPPPPPSFLAFAKHTNIEHNKIDSNIPLLNKEKVSVSKYNYIFDNLKVVSFNKSIQPVIQEGPSCGIVALSMASQYFQNLDPNILLTTAKEWKFSKSGEIFSAYNMSSLASSVLNCDATVINNVVSNKDLILNHICSGWPVLMPYDADKNHEPCLNNGRSAHWAVLTGICFTVPDFYDQQHEIEFETILSNLKVHFSENDSLVKQLLKYAINVFVYAHQGKSKHLSIWDFNKILQSNNNLYEVTTKYEIDMLILPENDSLSELRDKCVLLKNS